MKSTVYVWMVSTLKLSQVPGEV